MSSLLEKELDKLNVFDQEVVFSVLSKALGEFIGIKIPLWTVEAEFSETSHHAQEPGMRVRVRPRDIVPI